MKSFRMRDLWWCALIVLVYAVLFQVMARTHLIEKVMASTFSWWELLLIAGFLITRILSYLLVPSVFAALGVYILSKWLLNLRRANGASATDGNENDGGKSGRTGY